MVMARYLLIVLATIALSIQIIAAQNIADKPGDVPIQITDFQVSLVNVMKWETGSGGNSGMAAWRHGRGLAGHRYCERR